MSSTQFSGQQYVPQTFSPVTFTFFSLHKYYDLPAAVTSKSHLLASYKDPSEINKNKHGLCNFTQKKCNSLTVTRSQSPFRHSYKLKGHNLKLINSAKYRYYFIKQYNMGYL